MRKSLTFSKVITLLTAAVLLNLIACSQASFESTGPVDRAQRPAPDNVTNQQTNNPDNGDVVDCSNPNSVFCGDGTDFTDEVPPLTYTPPTCDDHVPTTGNCYENTFANTTRGQIGGVDLWLVVDSSVSFDKVRLSVGQAAVRSFISGVDVRISVIPAHAPSSSYTNAYGTFSSFHGRIYKQVTIKSNFSSAQLAAAEAELLSSLGENMQESPISLAKRDGASIDGLSWNLGGPHSGSDEFGLSSFMAAMDNYTIPANHAWAVLFLADENDVCMPERAADGGHYFSHPNEQEMYTNRYCGNVSARRAYQKALSYAGDRPFALGAMTYLKYNTIPSSAHSQSSVGIGYTDIVGLAHSKGALVDLAARNTRGLNYISRQIVQGLGQITNNSVGFQTHYPIYDSNGNQISLNRVQRVSSGQGTRLNLQVFVAPDRSYLDNPATRSQYRVNYSYDSQRSLIEPLAKGKAVRIEYCLEQ